MPKHVHADDYLSNPYAVLPVAIVHPDIEHVPDDAEHYMLPAVFTLAKGEKFEAKYPGPGVYDIQEGEIEYEDTGKNPGHVVKLSAGAVLRTEQDALIRWYSPSIAKGQESTTI